MKLWQKISIVCILVLLVIVAFTSLLLLSSARNSVLELTVANAKEKQSSLASSFVNLARITIDDDTPPQEQEQIFLNCFATFADETSVLVHGYESLYTFVDMEPQDILPLSTFDQRIFLDEVGNRNLLIVGNLVTISNTSDPYAVYIVRDISNVYRSINQLALRTVIGSSLLILIGTTAIVLLVRAASRPLKTLRLAARRIAGGQYAERVKIATSDEVGELAEDFNLMAEAVETHIAALEERNTRQELFIGGVTHEFKTPMTSMMLHTETLLNMRLSPEQQEKSLRHIRSQCQWLDSLTKKLMSLITLGEDLKVSPCSVPALLERVRESTTETLANRGTPLEIECSALSLPMDADLMQSLLINLVDNASKASNPGDTILLAAKGNTISVSDHGRGIPAEAIARVTEPFYMVDKSRSKKQGGSGLGLALVKRIADAHGADLKIESVLGCGTTISVTLPNKA